MDILGPMADIRNLSLVALCGGVGGARLVNAVDKLLPTANLVAVVNVGDDEPRYGVHVAADLDTVLYTLAGVAGPHGWGIDGDTTTVMDTLSRLGVDTTFHIGDRDFAHCLWRSNQLAAGASLSSVTSKLASTLGVRPTVRPASDDVLSTWVQIDGITWISFQEYFVDRHHRDRVTALDFRGAADASPAPGVLDSISRADAIVIAPSNPPLSIWPMLAMPALRNAVEAHPCVIAISPLFAGAALKGPAANVLESLGVGSGTSSILAAYEAVIDYLIVDTEDAADVALSNEGVQVSVCETHLTPIGEATELVEHLSDIVRGNHAD